jgi:hypothetical protein
VSRRQPDGTWLRLLDQPEFIPPAQQITPDMTE